MLYLNLGVVFAAVSLITFILYGLDKYKACHGLWRIPEKVLLGFSFFGGAVGGMVGGMMNDAVNSATAPAPKPAGDSMADFKQKLEKLMLMKEMGALSEEEFAAAKANLLSQL